MYNTAHRAKGKKDMWREKKTHTHLRTSYVETIATLHNACNTKDAEIPIQVRNKEQESNYLEFVE